MKATGWNSCLVFTAQADNRRLWLFEASGRKAQLKQSHTFLPGETLPARTVAKDWHNLWQKKLNIAWLPSRQVFLRVVQLPKCEPDELQSMVELQLEKISPLPVAQVVWSFETISQPADGLATVVVVIVERGLVAEYLGQLEAEGYLADRLEFPLLRQLKAIKLDRDATWVFANVAGAPNQCLVAWVYGGVMQNLSLLHLVSGENPVEALSKQLAQTAWAGEVEGWLTVEPRWVLVTPPEKAELWRNGLTTWSGSSVEVIEPLTEAELATQSAENLAPGLRQADLLPSDFATRYRQQFIDHLWMRVLGAVVTLYIVGVVIYFAGVQVVKYQLGRVENQITERTKPHKETLQTKERLGVLQEQVGLKFAALDCLQAAAELLPTELQLTQLQFQRGKTFTLYGTATPDNQEQITEYNAALAKATVDGLPVFAKVNAPTSQMRGNVLTWTFSCELRNAAVP